MKMSFFIDDHTIHIVIEYYILMNIFIQNIKKIFKIIWYINATFQTCLELN